jgi:phosphoglycolate phosphatase-like HAD superfamily hydrolase
VKLLLFDIDQTLINTGGAGLRALDRACKKLLGIEKAMDGISPHGKTDPAIVREILSIRLGTDAARNGHLESILESYIFFLREEVQTSTAYRVLPGILSLLTEISSLNGVALGLATGNIELGARIKLERGGLNRYFEVGGFGSDSENRSELVRKGAEKAAARTGISFRPCDTFVIGDTPLDIDAGRAAGFKTVGVATGSYSLDQLIAAGATFAVSDLEQGRDQFFRSTFME